jgi:ppGpp synthetase/RelA/SpoT-type nucleotidyltranferase
MQTKKADKLPQLHSTTFQGIPIIIQWPKNSIRVGKHDDGTPYKTEMHADYGFVEQTTAAGDNERLDVYIGDDSEAEFAYVIEQLKDDESFDEYKVMLGFSSLEDARNLYIAQAGEDKLGDISEVPFKYLFDTVMEERKENKEQEREELKTEIKEDEAKIASADSVIDIFVKHYKHEIDFYEEAAEQTQDALAEALQDAGIRAIVSSRAKKPNSLYKKLYKRNKNYQTFRDIKEDIVDLAGVRVSLYLPADKEAVGQIINTLFTPVRKTKHFPLDREPGDSLGYVADHYLVQLKPENLHKKELRYADTNIEIQVASVLMVAWSELTHDLIYKPEKGQLTEKEMYLVKELNDIVQAGEATLTKLQESVENRTSENLRFDLTAAMTNIGQRLQAQIPITASEIAGLASKIASLEPQNAHTAYLRAQRALWRAHKADELDDRLRAYNDSLRGTLPVDTTGEEVFIYRALEQLYPGVVDMTVLPKPEQSKVVALAQKLKFEE